MHGPSTIHNLVYAYALNVAADILDAACYPELARKYRSEKKDLLKIIENLCYSKEMGLYREGPAFEEYSQHAQIWAVLCGLADGEKARQIMKAALCDNSLVPCSFVMQFYQFRALEMAGMYEETKNLWDLWKNLLDLDLSTVPEIPGKYTRSDCHAWGALLLHELPRKFLGVGPLSPGYEKVIIKPMGLYIGGISGEVPTPHGRASVKWLAKDGEFSIEGNTPVPAVVVLPDNSAHEASGKFSFAIKLR